MIASIDFGASTTKAAVREEDESSVPTMVRFAEAEDFPSAVYVTPRGTLEVGRRALAYAGRDPLRLCAQIKRHVHMVRPVAPVDRVLHTGAGKPVPLVSAIAAILGHAYEGICAAASGHPSRLLLTHPAEWGEPEQLVLRRAASAARLSCPVSLLPEPEAVAHAAIGSEGMASPDAVAVFDLGASTFDTALLARSPYGMWETAYCRGRLAGGDDFDELVLSEVEDSLDSLARTTLDALREQDPYGVWSAARAAKEELSENEETYFAYEAEDDPLPDTAVYREDFEQGLESLLRPCLADLEEALSATPATASMRVLVLSGGSTAVPRIREAVQEIAERSGVKMLSGHGGLRPEHLAAWGAVRAARPYRLHRTRWGRLPTAGDVVAVPGNRVAQSGASREITLLRPGGEVHANVLAGGPPGVFRRLASDAERLVSATDQGLIEVWSAPAPRGGSRGNQSGLNWHGSLWNSPATAISVRGERLAWTAPDGSAVTTTVSRRPLVALANVAPLRGLAFLGPSDVLLAWSGDRLFLHNPADGRMLSNRTLEGERPLSVAVHAAEGLVLVRGPRCLYAVQPTPDAWTQLWNVDLGGAGPVCSGTFEGRPVAVTYGQNPDGVVAVDGVTGAVLAREDLAAGDRPDQILAVPDEAGVFLVRVGGWVHRLELLS